VAFVTVKEPRLFTFGVAGELPKPANVPEEFTSNVEFVKLSPVPAKVIVLARLLEVGVQPDPKQPSVNPMNSTACAGPPSARPAATTALALMPRKSLTPIAISVAFFKMD